jgi:hypothetical protein
VADTSRKHVRGHHGIARVISPGIGDDRIKLEIPMLRSRFGDAEQSAAQHALRHNTVGSVRRNENADGYAQFGHRQLKLPRMSMPPVKLLWAPLPWPLSIVWQARSWAALPRAYLELRRRLRVDFGLAEPSNNRARAAASSKPGPLLGGSRGIACGESREAYFSSGSLSRITASTPTSTKYAHCFEDAQVRGNPPRTQPSSPSAPTRALP